MNKCILTVALLCSLGLATTTFAQAPKKGADKSAEKKAPAPKTPAELAVDEFNKARNAPAARAQAGFSSVIASGMAFLTQFPTHSSVSSVVNNLGSFGNNIDPKQPALRTSYTSLLKLEIANLKYKDGVTEPTVAALAALDAVVADFEVRQSPTPGTLANLREKIDALAETPGGTRFLAERERAYSHLLTLTNQMPKAETQLEKLSKHADKGVAGMAREELNLINLKKAPLDLKFTALDGKPVDLASFRGKVVALYFWSSTNTNSTKEFERLKQLYSDYRKRGFDLVTVSYDKEEDREKLVKYIKDNRIAWPVYYDGKAAKNDFSPKLNAYSVPRLMVFDQQGLLQTVNVNNNLTANIPTNQLEAQIKRLLKIK